MGIRLIILTVRYLLIALMIVLLPLRGWAGNAMAIDMTINMAKEMTVQQVLAVQARTASTAISADVAGALPMPADCTMRMQGPDDAADKASTQGLHCHSCDTCQLCLALAPWTPVAWPVDTLSRPAAPLATDHDFRSATATASFKPPIS